MARVWLAAAVAACLLAAWPRPEAPRVITAGGSRDGGHRRARPGVYVTALGELTPVRWLVVNALALLLHRTGADLARIDPPPSQSMGASESTTVASCRPRASRIQPAQRVFSPG